MAYPEELKYSKSHEWVKENEDGSVLVGITTYAAEELGDVVYVDLPEEEDTYDVGEEFGEAESVKAVAEIISPVSGVIAEVNEALEDEPELLNESPHETWIVRIEDVSETEDLMSASEYEAYLKEL